MPKGGKSYYAMAAKGAKKGGSYGKKKSTPTKSKSYRGWGKARKPK